jgi:predicted phosphodiesterase
MARYGVIADIHGNREALDAVLAELERRGVQRIVCLGDIVGYNADPNECAAIVRRRCAVSIVGNHEEIGLGRLDFRRCSKNAEYALRRTRKLLSRESANWLASLPPNQVLEDGVVLVHGGVRDVQQYMTSPAHIAENALYLAADFPGVRLCFFGHSHEQRVYEVNALGVSEVNPAGQILLGKENTYFINPGSVDASRKSRHKLAEFAVFDSGSGELELARVAYHAAATEAKAAAFGYRINALTDQFYTLRRRTASAARRIGARLQRAAGSGR